MFTALVFAVALAPMGQAAVQSTIGQVEPMRARAGQRPRPAPKPPVAQDLGSYLAVEVDPTKPSYDGMSINPMRLRSGHPTSALRVTYRRYFWNEGMVSPGAPTRERPQVSTLTSVVPRGGSIYLGVSETRHSGSFTSWHSRWEVVSATLAQ